MAIPDYQTLMLPLVQALVDGSERTFHELVNLLAVRFALTEAEREQFLPSGQQRVFSNRVGWSQLHLKYAGLIENPARGRVRITDLGRAVLVAGPATINVKFLKQYPAYLGSIGKPDSKPDALGVTIVEEKQTPLEQIESAYRSLALATAEEVLSRLRKCSPGFFEEVVVKLLLAMGYGGVAGHGTVTGRSGDGGIDGVIRQDKLGLEIVCVQAKRWEGSVGRPIIQGFVGSMDYVKARKGVILTTSTFTKDGLDFVDRIENKKVVLIDGARLVDLMVEHNLGVTASRTYTLKEVSNDFFDEGEA